MADEDRVVGADVVEQAEQVGRQVIDAIGVDVGRRGGVCVAALVGHEHPVAGVDERLDLVPPRVRTLRKSVDEHHDRIAGFTGVDHVQFDPVGCHTPLLPCHGEHGRRRTSAPIGPER